MPWRKRLQVLSAVALALGLVALAAALASTGHARGALLLAGGTALATLLVLHALWPAFDLGGRSLRRGVRGGNAVALTFDDGPSGDTPAVLDALDRVGVAATFFVLGEAAERRPDLVREIARRGHAVALHGHTHARLALAGPRRVADEIDRCLAAVRTAGVEPARWFRAPHGWKGPFLARALRARGLTLVAWTRGAWDSERPGPAAIAERASRNPRDGEILLLHDGCGTPGIDPRRDQTAEALPEIVRRWREAGYRFVALDDLAPRGAPGAAGAPPAPRRGTRRLARAAALLALAAAAAVALVRVDLREMARSLAGARPGLLALAAAANLASLAAHASRWRSVVRAPGVSVRWRDALAALVAGFAAGIVLPARGGDVLRAHLLARRAGLATASVLAASGLDYVVGTVALVALLGALVLSAPLPPWVAGGLAATAVLAAAGAIAAWLLRPPRAAGGRRDTGLVARLRAGLGAVRAPRALLEALGWALAGWAAEVAIALATLAALGLPVTFTAAALAVVAASAAAAAALVPGNAGSFELATAMALAGTGVPPGTALAFAVAFHLVHLVPVAVIGGAVLVHAAAGASAPDRR